MSSDGHWTHGHSDDSLFKRRAKWINSLFSGSSSVNMYVFTQRSGEKHGGAGLSQMLNNSRKYQNLCRIGRGLCFLFRTQTHRYGCMHLQIQALRIVDGLVLWPPFVKTHTNTHTHKPSTLEPHTHCRPGTVFEQSIPEVQEPWPEQRWSEGKETEILFSSAWHWCIHYPLPSVITLCLPGKKKKKKKKEKVCIFFDPDYLDLWILSCCFAAETQSWWCLQKVCVYCCTRRRRHEPLSVTLEQLSPTCSSALEQSTRHASLWLLRSTGSTSVSLHPDWDPHMACLSGLSGSAHDLPEPDN